jgi:hypothetical protein
MEAPLLMLMLVLDNPVNEVERIASNPDWWLVGVALLSLILSIAAIAIAIIQIKSAKRAYRLSILEILFTYVTSECVRSENADVVKWMSIFSELLSVWAPDEDQMIKAVMQRVARKK